MADVERPRSTSSKTRPSQEGTETKLAQELSPSYPDAHIDLDLRGVSEEPLTSSEAMTYVIRAFHPEAKPPESSE